MNLREMMNEYSEKGLTREHAAARVCQDIVLKAIPEGPLSRNVTIKDGIVMRSLTQNNRRATQDIDLDFIHYSLDDASIRSFVDECEKRITNAYQKGTAKTRMKSFKIDHARIPFDAMIRI